MGTVRPGRREDVEFEREDRGPKGDPPRSVCATWAWWGRRDGRRREGTGRILLQAPHPCPEDGHAVFVASVHDRGPSPARRRQAGPPGRRGCRAAWPSPSCWSSSPTQRQARGRTLTARTEGSGRIPWGPAGSTRFRTRPARSARGGEPSRPKADLMPDGLNGREPDRNSMGTGPNPHRWPPGKATPATSQFEPGRDGMLSVIMSTRTRARERAPSVSAQTGEFWGIPRTRRS